ncbi:MAG: VOC family protein [Leptospirales bacterium]
MIKSIAFTIYPVHNMTRARQFYEEDLGLGPTKDFENSWVEYDLPGGTFILHTLLEAVEPSSTAGGCIAFEVDDLDRVVLGLKAKGYRFKIEPFSSPICRMAVVKDPEGNQVTLHQSNASTGSRRK